MLETQPLISVIVPIYNIEPYLERSLDSILNQTYRNIELLLIDDGSTDGSVAICDRYAERDPRIVLFHQKNGGLSAARNLGLEHARGEYISFIDSDDYVAPCFLELLYQNIRAEQADIAACCFAKVKNGRIIPPSQALSPSETHIDTETLLRWEVSGQYMFCVSSCNKLFKAELWKDLRFKERVYSEDSYAYNEYIKSIRRIGVVSEALYYYVQRSNSATHVLTFKSLDGVEARLERTAYFLSIHRPDLARGELLLASGPLLTGYSRLDQKDQQVKSRLAELYARYQALYRQAECGLTLSGRSLRSWLLVSNRPAAVFMNQLTNRLRRRRAAGDEA